MRQNLKNKLANWLIKVWYRKSRHWFAMLLLPFSLLVGYIAQRRYHSRLRNQSLWRANVPVVVVGNLTVGGTGKTPLVIELANYLKNAGYVPGIISRGYGSRIGNAAHLVSLDSNPNIVGDEPVMLVQNLNVPVVVSPDRTKAAQFLLQKSPDCSVIISDDGLQHAPLWRDIEIVVLDGVRMLGNRLCLPSGPLRESPSRLSTVDFIITNGAPSQPLSQPFFEMIVEQTELINLTTGESIQANKIAKLGSVIHAVAGIGHPERFFKMLQSNEKIKVISHPFVDHHTFCQQDFSFLDANPFPVVMTEKDAVKCRDFAGKDWWYLKTSVKLPDLFWNLFFDLLSKKANHSAQPTRVLKRAS